MSNQFSKKLLVGGLLTALSASSTVFADMVELYGTLRDFSSHHPDFNSQDTGPQIGCVNKTLGADRKPVFVPDNRCAITQPNDWYNDTDANQSMPFSIALDNQKTEPGGHYRYAEWGFFPIDNVLMGNENRKHNFNFTYELHGELTYLPGQELFIRGDDGLWLFINGKLVIDLGGVKSFNGRSIKLDDFGLTSGQTYQFDLFGAERRANMSRLVVRMKAGMSCETQPQKDSQKPSYLVGKVIVSPLPEPELLEIDAPIDGSRWHIPPGCTTPRLLVQGKAAMKAEQGPLDLVLVIDRSGSTEREGPEQEGGRLSVLESERIAANNLIDMLEKMDNARLGLVSFSQDVILESPLTNDWDSLRNAVAGITVPKGGTNIEIAIDMSLTALQDARANAQKNVILMTDGVPTLPVGSGMTQEEEDRVATLQAARRARDAEVRIYPIVIKPKDYTRNLTTMPAVQAITKVPGTIGQLSMDNLNELSNVLTHLVLSDVTNVDITNLTMGVTVAAEIFLDGRFQGEIPVQVGNNQLQISAHAGNPDKATVRTLFVPVGSSPDTGGQALNCGN
jgi:fibro-slime domain-containing protein